MFNTDNDDNNIFGSDIFDTDSGFGDIGFKEQPKIGSNQENQFIGGSNTIQSEEETEENHKNTKRIAVISSIAGLSIMLLALSMSSCVRNIKNKQALKESSAVIASNDISNGSNVVKEESKASNSEGTVAKNSGGGESISNGVETNVSISNKKDWVEFEPKDYGESSDAIESIFTVTDIKGYVNNSNQNGNVLLRYVAIGNVIGIKGEYELNINYRASLKLSAGTQIKVWYRTVEVENKKIIVEISYN